MPLTVIQSEQEYLDAIKASGISAVEFVAPWDESSKAISPKFQEYSDNPRWKDIHFYKLDICDQQDAAMTAHVDLAPTFHFYRDGAKIKEYVGSSYPALEVRSLSPSS
ncbi:hypothetical protein JCM9279_007297, partial [Rhodotorula babjevae]